MEKFYRTKRRRIIKRRVQKRKRIWIRGLVLKFKGRIRGLSRARKLILIKGGTGSLKYKKTNKGINTKWGIINLTILKNN